MGNNLTTASNDGFDDVPLSNKGAIRGALVTHKDGAWLEDRANDISGETRVVVAVRRGWLHWVDGMPNYHLDPPGEPHPKRESLGDDNKARWRRGLDGQPEDPWRDVWVAFFADQDSGAESTFVTWTDGGFIAVEDLITETRKKRRNGMATAFPVVTLESVPFKTRYGVKSRPSFKVEGWVCPAGESTTAPEPPPAPLPQRKMITESGKPTPPDPLLDDDVAF